MKCRLCGEERALCRSHVIPEFFYDPLYDDGHRIHQHSRGSGKVRVFQKGHREPLLCATCEDLLNERYEKYFKAAWYDNGALPRTPDFQQRSITRLDYHRFKLCLLSILWRASIATQEFFSQVRLGPKHEAAIRQMLLEDNPGPEDLYPFMADVLWLTDIVTHSDYVVRSALMQPVDRKHGHKRVYLFWFGGCMWYFLVGSETDGLFRTLTIQRDGTLPIMWQNFAKLPMLKDFLVDHLKAARKIDRQL